MNENLIVFHLGEFFSLKLVCLCVCEKTGSDLLLPITRVPEYPGNQDKKLSITRVLKIRVFWTHYL